MMFAWGLAVPVALIYALYHPQTHPWANAAMVAGAMLVAITWYVHMPAASQCTAMYPQTGMACSVLQWGFSMSLGVATAAYVFLVFMIALSSLGLLVDSTKRLNYTIKFLTRAEAHSTLVFHTDLLFLRGAAAMDCGEALPAGT
jgi:hypothetical protein